MKHKILNTIIDILFPQVCSICGKLNQEGLCVKCRNMLEKLAIFEVTNENKYFEELIPMKEW